MQVVMRRVDVPGDVEGGATDESGEGRESEGRDRLTEGPRMSAAHPMGRSAGRGGVVPMPSALRSSYANSSTADNDAFSPDRSS